MPLNLLAIDVGKYSFHVFGIDEDGLVISRKVIVRSWWTP